MTSNPTNAVNVTTSPSSNETNNQSPMITTAIQTEIAFICNMLSKLFESTRHSSDQALMGIFDALLQLSIESADKAYLKNEPCLFAIAKIYETSISNLNRIELYWPQISMHFLC